MDARGGARRGAAVSEPTLYDVAAARLEQEVRAANPYVPPLAEILDAEQRQREALARLVDAGLRCESSMVRSENQTAAREVKRAAMDYYQATEDLARLRGVHRVTA